jgi:hypothetical protein
MKQEEYLKKCNRCLALRITLKEEKNEPTQQQVQTPAIDESIRFVREQITREKKDAPVRNKPS